MSHPEKPLSEIAIADLNLSMKAYASLKRLQINSIEDLMSYTQEDLIILDRESGEEVIAALRSQLGLVLPVE